MDRIKRVVAMLLLLLGIYSLLRMAFYLFYFEGNDLSFTTLCAMFYWGMRIDFAILFYLNLPFVAWYLFIDGFVPRLWQRVAMLVLWWLPNAGMLAVNTIDLAYFGFINRRSTVDLLYVAGDSLKGIGSLLVSYWYLLLFFGLATVGLYLAGKKWLYGKQAVARIHTLPGYSVALVVLIILGVFARGTADRPLLPSTPLLYFPPQYQPLVNNSTYTFLYSVLKRQQQLAVKIDFTPKTLDSIFTIRRQYSQVVPFAKKNVVVIILESFSKELLQAGSGHRASTPFLDSIIAQSTWCNNAYANGLMSNQGIVSILASMPPFLDEPYYHSVYSNNALRGIGEVLKEQGYATHFFMGAGSDHFGFAKFCRLVGIDRYHSRDDFNDNRFDDGHWGIFDHKFLPFAAGVLNREPKPFLAVLFNLSSHDPYILPPDLRSRFRFPGQQPFQRSVAYVDYSLRLFFDSVKHTDWYKNTLFVFTADHTNYRTLQKAGNNFTAYRIPIFLFNPAEPVYRVIDKPVQQMDIVPTILDRLHYAGPFMAFGRSVDDTAVNYMLSRPGSLVQVLDSSFLLGYNDATSQPVYLYRYHQDEPLQHNLLHDTAYREPVGRLQRYLKAVIQRYNNSLINNDLLIK
jgi:phosphoglycerol transferase MdoB-like AlkP superfamily enzyme